MTRTAVRRYVELSDGRLVIRTITVEAPVGQPQRTEQAAPVAASSAACEEQRASAAQRRANRVREALRRGMMRHA